MLGTNPLREPWTAWQLRSAVFTFGHWFEMQIEAMKEAPMPETKRKPTMMVPKFSNEDLRAMLGVAPKADMDFLRPDAEMDRQAAELQSALSRGQMDWSTFGISR